MADQQIQRNVAVIIGTGGMGLAVARRFAAGRHLILADYSDTNLEAALTALRNDGHSAQGYKVNIADYSAVEIFAQTAKSAGRIEIVVHTAGVAPGTANARQIFEVDLLGTANVIEAFLAVISPGTSMICVASMAGHFASLSPELERHLAIAPRDQLLQHAEIDIESSNPNEAYTISKRGNQLRVQGFAHAWGSKGARLNSISPGVISTALLRAELETPRGASPRAMVENSAARRIGTPDDIANVAAFLAGPESSFIIGNDILVDGGAVSARRWSK